jgi:DNA-binding NarL/FixJ family response regulator
MEGKSAIWVIASRRIGKHVQDVLDGARLINPIKLIETSGELAAALHSRQSPPPLILLDVSLPDGVSWDALKTLGTCKLESQVMALVDGESETLLDRAYEAGIKTYLRKDFSFSDFLDRARALNLQFLLGRENV